MKTRVWTLSNPVTMEPMCRLPGNKQAPAAILFRTKEEAEAFIELVKWRGRRAYELEITGTFEDNTTRSGSGAQVAFHLWHIAEGAKKSPKCGVCMSWRPTKLLAADALTHEALIINPDTGEPA